LAIPGSNQAGFGSGMASVPWQMCLGTRQGTLGLGTWVRRRASPGCGTQGPRGGLRALGSNTKERGGRGVDHRGFTPAGDAAEEGVAGLIPASGSRGSIRGAPAEVLRGSGRSVNGRRRGIAAAEQLTGGDARARFRRCRSLGPGLRALEAFWGYGGAIAVACRGWSAAERRGYGGARASSRQSKVDAIG